MNKIITIVLLTIYLFFNMCCKKDSVVVISDQDSVGICDCNNVINKSLNNQLYTKWVYESFETFSGEKEFPPLSLNKMNIEFSNDTLLSVQGPVNSGWTNYQLYENNCIKISNIGATKLGGTIEQMDWENKYFNSLRNTECYKISLNNLKIYFTDNSNQKIMNFKKQ